jgi:hypothetical protein
MAKDLLQKLKQSHTVLSLQAEQRAAKTLAALGWTCFQGAFYRDLRDEKLRETDVIARQIWERGDWRTNGTLVRLNLILECKSARDWQLVFAQGQRENRVGHVARVWSGFAEDRFEWLHRALKAHGIPEASFVELRSRFKEHAFPDDRALPYGMMPDAPRSRVVVTAFRETNLDKEKDLESSVFWRATTSLRSATRSLTALAMERHSELFEIAASQLPFSWANFLIEFDDACNESVRQVDIFHPVVLIDSPMWLLREGRLRSISQSLSSTWSTWPSRVVV